MSRTTKLTDAIRERVCESLRDGNTHKAAAEYAGICEKTFYNWRARGRQARRTKKGTVYKADVGFLQFLQSVTRAENEAEVRNVAALQKAANGWPVKKTTARTVRKVIGKTKSGQPIFAEETTTETTEYTEYDWRAALEWLKRRFPKQWGDKLRIEQIVEDELSEALDRLQARLAPSLYDEVLAVLTEEPDGIPETGEGSG